MKRMVLLAALAAATVSPAGWWRTYGGEGYDAGRCVQQTSDGGYVITGTTLSYGEGKADLWLIKTDTIGDTLWSKTHGRANTNDAGYFVRQTIDGGYIVAGRLSDSIWLLKTNNLGDTLWTKSFGSYAGYCIQETNDGGYILTGREGDWYNPRLFLLKTDSNGDSLWMQTYLLDAWRFSIGYYVEQTEDAGFIVAGMLRDTLLDHQRTAFWLVKTDSVGDTLWTYTQGGDWEDLDIARCVRQMGDEGYIALGTIGLLRLNTQGDTLWLRDYRNGSSVDVTTDSGFILTGDAEALQAVSELNTMPNPLWLNKTNNNGDSLWKQFYPGGASFYVEETLDKGFIVTGMSGSNSGDIFLLKTDSLGLLGITENPIVESDNGWNVPHAIGSYIVLHYQGLPQGFHAEVFDVSGRKVDEIRGDGNEGAMTWGINQPPGVYFIQALDNRNQLKTAKVVLVR